MAGIDKTYISNFRTYKKIVDWAKNIKVNLPNGKFVNLIDYVYYPNITKEEWDNWKNEYKEEHPNTRFDIVLWNTPTFIDVWLIKNCPFEEIQNRLKEQYGGGWSKLAFTNNNEDNMYEQIKNGTSIYDTYKRNGLGKKSKVVFHNLWGNPIRDKNQFWFIEVNPYWINGKRQDYDNQFWYNEDEDMWYDKRELMPTNTNTAHKRGCLTKKNIVNLIKKWNLPKGSKVHFSANMGRYCYQEFWTEVK